MNIDICLLLLCIGVLVTQGEEDRPRRVAQCKFNGRLSGSLNIHQHYEKDGKALHITGKLHDLSPGWHGVHIHVYGDLSDDCAHVGGHYNPGNHVHGFRHYLRRHRRHAGDLENIFADENRVSEFSRYLNELTVKEVVGMSIVVHVNPDDLGLGDDPGSRLHGNAGDKIDCCLIEWVHDNGRKIVKKNPGNRGFSNRRGY